MMDQGKFKLVELAKQDVQLVAARFVMADYDEAQRLKRYVSGKAGGAERAVRRATDRDEREAYRIVKRIYSNAAIKLTPRRIKDRGLYY